jgi:hypothetical protein
VVRVGVVEEGRETRGETRKGETQAKKLIYRE